MRFGIIDIANLFARAQHATRGDAYTKAGMALHIIFMSLRKLRREMQVDHMVFCVEGRSWRYDTFPQYKARRKLDKMTKPVKDQEEDEVFFEIQKDFIDYLAEKTRCTVLQSQGVEGDDFVARWIQLHPNDDHFILSSDSDFIQLLAPNVTLVDGMAERVITVDGVKNFSGEALAFTVDPSSGKLKVPGTIAEMAEKHKREQKEKRKKDPGHVITEYVFTPPEADWWRRALFIKCVRGDVGDGIFSAYPGVRYEGSSKKTGIREAWEDRNAGGFHWNNFMLTQWEKAVGRDEKGETITQQVRVMNEYAFNQSLIDLTAQPEKIKQLMDEVIVQAVQKEPVGNVGINFMKFCAKNDLTNLNRDANDHAAYLNRGYSG
jgi:hypothetical protein